MITFLSFFLATKAPQNCPKYLVYPPTSVQHRGILDLFQPNVPLRCQQLIHFPPSVSQRGQLLGQPAPWPPFGREIRYLKSKLNFTPPSLPPPPARPLPFSSRGSGGGRLLCRFAVGHCPPGPSPHRLFRRLGPGDSLPAPFPYFSGGSVFPSPPPSLPLSPTTPLRFLASCFWTSSSQEQVFLYFMKFSSMCEKPWQLDLVRCC